MGYDDFDSMIDKTLAMINKRSKSRVSHEQEKYERTNESLKQTIYTLLTEAETYYPEYYFAVDDDGNALDELQPNFNSSGILCTDDFEVVIHYRGNRPSDIWFTLYNYDADMEEYDTIVCRGQYHSRIQPFESSWIESYDFFQYPIVERIYQKAIQTIRTFIDTKTQERNHNEESASKVNAK